MKGTEAEACTATMQACIPKVTRLVLIHHDERTTEAWNVDVKFELQDNCQTLKIFTKPKKRSDIAKDLGTSKYRQRVVPDKRKKKKEYTKEDYLKELLGD